VAVLDGGRVIEAGRPTELLATDGPYRRLFDDHGELILDEEEPA
jgi:ABC-type multidrug transport system fused ATPase/permease subunit